MRILSSVLHMLRRTSARSVFVAYTLTVGVALFSVDFFLRDLGVANLKAWGAAAVLVGGVSASLFLLPRGSFARALLFLLALPVAGFLLVYDVLDAALDPFIEADWPIAVVACLLSLMFELLMVATFAEDD